MSDESAGQRPRFRRQVAAPPVPADPESLFGELPHGPHGVPALWSHQADLLRSYADAKMVDAPDIALELPTGSGKTLVGLLIADWRRRHHRHRVVYACPTKQLARQVAVAAGNENIPATLLIGRARNWDQAEVSRYATGQAVAVTVYSHVFNTRPKFEDAQALLFDDAHAAEGYVAEAWSLSIPKGHSAYAALLDQVRGDLDPQLVSWMTDPDADAATARDVRLLPLATVNAHIRQIDRILAGHCRDDDDTKYAFEMIRPGLPACLFYLSPAAWYIRPMIPPTFDHPAFTDPAQRIYLSATLGDAGELERAFGRTGITRIPVPPAWERTGAGRRFFVFPDLATGRPPGAGSLLKHLVDLADRRIVLTPDDAGATRIADELDVPPEQRFTAKDPDTGLAPFLSASRATLLAASRYDGMDLHGDTCRMMVLSGVPDAMHPQDRFLATRLRAVNVLNERVRARVIQGAGRCTRGPRDYAVVVVEGSDMLRFLCREDVRAAMPIEMQAEIAFGLDNSRNPARDLIALAESAYRQDEVWQQDAEPELAERRRELERALPPETANLARSAPGEVEAWQAAWGRDWEGAARAAVAVLEHLTESGLRPYRSLWAYLGSCWSTLAAAAGQPAAADRAATLMRTAHKAATGSPWLREIQPTPAGEPERDPLDEGAAAGILAALGGALKSASVHDSRCAEMLAGLGQSDAEPYERALEILGTLLGAAASKPPGKGRTDSAWVWPYLWATLEAKSEQETEGTVSMQVVRQANTQLDSLSADRAQSAPQGSFSVIVSPRRLIDPDAVPIARPHLHLVGPEVLLELAGDAMRAWTQVRGAAVGAGSAKQDAVARVLWEHRLLPTQVRERLTRTSVRGV
jgi:hypothetical protein